MGLIVIVMRSNYDKLISHLKYIFLILITNEYKSISMFPNIIVRNVIIWNHPNIIGSIDSGKQTYAINVMLAINKDISYIIN